MRNVALRRAIRRLVKNGRSSAQMISPVAAGIKAGLAALNAGEAEALTALPPAELRTTLGYDDYEAQGQVFRVT